LKKYVILIFLIGSFITGCSKSSEKNEEEIIENPYPEDPDYAAVVAQMKSCLNY
jgi:hypothetical protein